MIILISGCEEKQILSPDPKLKSTEQISYITDAEVFAPTIVFTAGWEAMEDETEQSESNFNKPVPPPFLECISSFERIPLTGNIVHYKFILKVGPGAYDQIGIHRVIKERKPFRPVKTKDVLFYQHGDAKDFEGMMLPGTRQPNTPDEFGMAIYLAQNDVDVWGIDQAWTMVPDGLGDYSFMANWGISKQVDDLNLAIGVARFTRLLTGNGLKKVILAGYSSGVTTTIALVNEETQLPKGKRQVDGYIPIDLSIKSDYPPINQYWEQQYYYYLDKITNGIYEDPIIFGPIGILARTDPSGPSPIFPGFTNLQTALYFGGGNIFGIIPFHYVAGIWENNFPIDFQFLTIDEFLDFLVIAVPYEPTQFMLDIGALLSDAIDVPFDDHFSEITVPILNVAPAGGFGEYTRYGISLMGSSDVTHIIPRTRPVGEELFDIAHIDIFIGNNAETVVWQPILNWIKAH